MKKFLPITGCRLPIEKNLAQLLAIQNSKLRIQNSFAFTLIELLAVITIIGVIAAFLVPTLGAVKRHELIAKTQAEMTQIETAIDRYKSAYGFYPPDNPNSPVFNPLYFELLGTTNTGTAFQTLDGNASMNSGNINNALDVSGFINCSKASSDESVARARNFLPDLKQNQMGSITNPAAPNVPIAVIIASAGEAVWRYNSHSPTNNPGSYDLWTQLIIKRGQTNLICNWSRQPQINSPLP